MLDLIREPWHWSIAGVFVGLTVPILLLLGNKKFGISSTLRQACAICIPAKIPFFSYDWKKEVWNLYFVLGILVGSFLTVQFIDNPNLIEVAESTKQDLLEFGITDYGGLLPPQIFNVDNIFSLTGLFFFVIGGFLVGFGTRYAAGCTSGHSIMGLANLQWPSLIATVFFMIGGFLSTHFLLPLIFKLV